MRTILASAQRAAGRAAAAHRLGRDHKGWAVRRRPPRGQRSAEGGEDVEPPAELLLLGGLDRAVVDHLLKTRRLLAQVRVVARRLRHHLHVVLRRVRVLLLLGRLLSLLHHRSLVRRLHELLRDDVQRLDLPGETDPHAGLGLDKAEEGVALLVARELGRVRARRRALVPQPVLREVVRLDPVALRDVAVVLVAVLGDAHVSDENVGG
mmetsp:Transcript_20271/g.34520  ORF Transcript_20271/g.34520 Transcript_20271/m.34520 type:complete len:208 (+) Transcript_20271:219-842(+)